MRTHTLPAAAACRWRWAVDDDGNQVRESNARFVRWSDGSLQLMVGEEVLDVKEIDTS
jgi:RNA polymerase-associated protein LEO1